MTVITKPSSAYETNRWPITASKLFPVWDSLRGDPRFEKIVASLAPKTVKLNYAILQTSDA